MIRSLYISALVALSVCLCGCTNNSDVEDDGVETQIHSDFVGELNVWGKSKTQNFTWEVLIADEDGDRTRISVTQYPGQEVARFKVESTCVLEEHTQILQIRNTSQSGSWLACDRTVNPVGFQRHDMIRLLDKTPIPPESIAQAIRKMRDPIGRSIDVPIDDTIIRKG